MVFTYDLNSLTFEWEYEAQPPGVDLTTTTVDIQRSETDDFSTYSTIAAGLNANNNLSYTDTALSGVVTRRYNTFNYRARFVELDGEETISDISWITQPLYLPAKDIIRRKDNILRLRGIPVYYLKRKSFGQPCTDCYDPIMDVQVDGNCSTCYNTRFVGGYYSAISLKAFMTETPDINLVNRFGEFNPGQMLFSVTSYPKLGVNDLVVDHLNRRWWVTNVRNASYRGHVITQDAVLTLADHNDVVYDVGVQ